MAMTVKDLENIDPKGPDDPHREAGDRFYPESDGKPMADNTKQFRFITTLKNGFDALYLNQDDVFVAGDLLWYPVEGDNKIRYAPDVMIALGRPKGDRGSYLQWEENDQPPNVVFEILSPGNTRPEMREKLAAYNRYGVDEYYEYDPDRGELRGWLRDPDDGELIAIPDMDHWQSPATGVTLHLEGTDLVATRSDGSVEETAEALAEHARRASQAEQLNQTLIEQLKAAGIEPEVSSSEIRGQVTRDR